MIQNEDYEDDNFGQDDDSEAIGDFFEREQENDGEYDQPEEIIISKSEKEEVNRIAKSLSNGVQLSPKDYEILKLFASNSITSILIKRGQKINSDELADMVQNSINSFWQHIDTHRGEVLENAPGYFYTVCQSIIYKIKVAESNKVYALFRRRFIQTVKKLENEQKIHSDKEKRAATPEKLKIPDGADDISHRSAAAEFEVKRLIQEERWTTERMSELEELLLHILNRITGSITMSQLEKCIADRIYLKQDFIITISPTGSRSSEDETRDEPAEPTTLPEEYSEPETDIYFQRFREELEAKIYELAASKKVAKKVLKVWHCYNFQHNTLEEVAEKFGYAGASGAGDAVKNSLIDRLYKYIKTELDKIKADSQTRETMMQIIMNDLDQIIPGL